MSKSIKKVRLNYFNRSSFIDLWEVVMIGDIIYGLNEYYFEILFKSDKVVTIRNQAFTRENMAKFREEIVRAWSGGELLTIECK